MERETKGKEKKKIKNRNNKMATNTYLSKIESNKETKQQEEQRQNHGNGEHFDGCQMGGGCLPGVGDG